MNFGPLAPDHKLMANFEVASSQSTMIILQYYNTL